MAHSLEVRSHFGHSSSFQMGDSQKTSWGEAVLGGLPHLLTGLVVGLPLLLATAGLSNQGSTLVSFLMKGLSVVYFLAILGSFSLAWRQGWPRWVASWYLYWGLAPLMAFGALINRWETGNTWEKINALLSQVIIPLVIAYLLYRITRYDRIRGLLAAIPLMMAVWTIYLEFVPDGPEGVTWVGSWVLAGLAAVGVLRLNRLDAGLALVLGMTVLVGLPYAYLGIYMGGALPFSEPGPSLAAVFKNYVPILAISASLVLGPLLACIFRDLALRSVPYDAWSYRLSLFGLLLLLVGVVVASYISTNFERLWGPFPALTPSLSPLIGLGLLAYATGFLLMVRTAWQSSAMPGWFTIPLIFLIPLGVPMALLFGLPNHIFDLPALPTSLFFTLELGWMVLAAWLVVYLHREMTSQPCVIIKYP